MFFFGLFSAHIPYILLSVLYLAGLGVFSFNSIKSKSQEKQPNDKIIYHSKCNSHKVILKKDTCKFNDFSKKQIKNIACKNYFIQVFYKKCNRFKILIKPIEEYSFQLIFSLFSRPPPSV